MRQERTLGEINKIRHNFIIGYGNGVQDDIKLLVEVGFTHTDALKVLELERLDWIAKALETMAAGVCISGDVTAYKG